MAIFTGKNVEEAISVGLNQLGIPRLKARIKVISKEKKGFLGFGKKPAQVDVSSLEEAQLSDKKASSVTSIFKERPKLTTNLDEKSLVTEMPTSDDSIETSETSSELKQPTVSDETTTQTAESLPVVDEESNLTTEETDVTEVADALVMVDEQPEGNSSFEEFVAKEFVPQELEQSQELADELQKAADLVTAYIQKIIYEMDLEATIETTTNRRRINLQIETSEPGRVIGYHGKVLKSLQLLAQNYLHDRYSRYYTVSINVHDYVQHRTETLIEFTHKIANRVLDSGESYAMDPMSNGERKTVHRTISQIEGVSSYSEGDDPNRYVVVALEK